MSYQTVLMPFMTAEFSCNCVNVYAECEDCGEKNLQENFTKVESYRNDKFYCSGCYANNFTACNDCEEMTANDDMHGEYCESCYDSNYTTCSDCHEITANDDMHGEYCESCCDSHYTSCEDCGDTVENNDTITVYNRRGHRIDVCDTCASDNYYYCQNCENRHHENNMHGDYCNDCAENNYSCEDCGDSTENPYDYESQTLCYSCYKDAKSDTVIKDYLYKPSPEFFKNHKAEKVFFGFEIEIENTKNADNEQTAKSITHETLYFKEDGSLDNGFEIVSHPLSFEYIKANKEEYKKRFETLINAGFRSSFYKDSTGEKTCGMHVHITKSQFSAMHLFKFLEFFKTNEKFIRAISQRQKTTFDQWAGLDAHEFSKSAIITKAKKKSFSTVRRLAVNLQNSNTVEIRIFQGTLKFESFMKNLEFCQAIFEFTKNSNMENCTLANFTSFAAKHKHFTNLNNFIKAKSLYS